MTSTNMLQRAVRSSRQHKRAPAHAGAAYALLAIAALGLPVQVHAQSPTQQAALSATYTQLVRLAPEVQQTSLSFNIDAGARNVIVNIASVAGNLSTSVQLPNGVVVNPQTAGAVGGVFLLADGRLPQGPLLFPFSSGGMHYVYRLPVTSSGTLTVRVSAPTAPPEQVAVIAQVQSDSAVATHAQFTEATVTVGRPVVLVAMVLDGATAVHGASVQARVLSATGIVETLALRDDGLAGDGAAADGLYSTVFTPTAPGTLRAAVEVSGVASVGAFSRQSAAALEVVPSSATLIGMARGRGIDLNGNGALEHIAVDVDIQAMLAGTDRVVIQVSGAGKKMLGFGDVTAGQGRSWAVRRGRLAHRQRVCTRVGSTRHGGHDPTVSAHPVRWQFAQCGGC